MVPNPNMVWFQGVVEDRQDPLFLGRVKVRCLGYHTPNKTQLPTDDLPWSHPVQPITSAAMSGIGDSPLGPVEGSWVVGFFRDGELCQNPVYFGTIGGIPTESPNPDLGFYDPNGNYPIEETLGEPATNRLARGQEVSTIVEVKKENLDESEVPDGGGSSIKLEEPQTKFAAEYPFNHVKMSESGHIFEVDDTPGAERITKNHRTGTFEEIHPNGERVLKVINNNYTAILGNDTIHVSGSSSVDVDQDIRISVEGNAFVDVKGNLDQHVGGNMVLRVDGSLEMHGQNVKVTGKPIDLN